MMWVHEYFRILQPAASVLNSTAADKLIEEGDDIDIYFYSLILNTLKIAFDAIVISYSLHN